MATKDVNIKIKVDGKEISLTGKQVDLFKKNIVDLKKQLEELGERTEENGEIFDKLKGDLQELEKIFGEVKEEAGQATEGMEELGDETEKTGGKTKTLRAELSKARNDLAALGARTTENAEEYDRLTNRVVELSEAYEEVQFGTKKLDDSLAALPGPIGKAASGFKVFDDGLKNARSAMANLTRTFPILKNAIAATGIGALVIIFGLLVAVVIKAFNSFKPLQDAVGKLGIVFDLLMELIQPLVELIGKGLTIALEGLAKALAFVTGNMDEFNKKVADKQATEALEKNVKRQEELLDSQGYKYDEFTKRKIQANLDYNKKKIEIDADETKSEADKLALLKQYRDKADNEINQADKDRQKKTDDAKKAADEATKAANQKAADVEKSFQSKLKSIRDENILLEIQDEAEKGRTKLKMDFDTQMSEINQLTVSEKKKEQLRKETLKNYELQLKQFNDNIIKEQKKADDDLARQTRDIRTSMIEDEKKRLTEEAANRRDDQLKAIDDTIASEEAKAQAKLAINEKYKKDIAKIDDDKDKEDQDNRLKKLDDELKFLQIKGEVLRQGTKAFYENQRAIIDTAEKRELQNLELTEAAKQAIIDKYAQLRKKSKEEEVAANWMVVSQLLDATARVTSAIASSYDEEAKTSKEAFEKRKKLQKATAVMSAASGIIQILTQPSTLPSPFDWIVKGINALALGISTATQIKNIDKVKFEGGGSSSGAPTPNLGRNYSEGGMIGGRRHAQGGTLIEAEQGEAVMTRGAVTMFAPMLSMMNQMGGGTAFGNQLFIRPDAAAVERPQQEQAPMIMKTYVVSNELTSESEKLARLKDLSTL